MREIESGGNVSDKGNVWDSMEIELATTTVIVIVMEMEMAMKR